MEALTAAAGAAGVILILELLLWLFFHSKIRGLSFPLEVDVSSVHFNSLRTMGILAVAHTLVVIIFVDFLLLSQW